MRQSEKEVMEVIYRWDIRTAGQLDDGTVGQWAVGRWHCGASSLRENEAVGQKDSGPAAV